MGADADGVAVDIAAADDFGLGDDGLELENACLNLGLLVFSLVIFAVFREIAVAACDFEALRDFLSGDGPELGEFFVEFGQSLVGEDGLFFHVRLPLSLENEQLCAA